MQQKSSSTKGATIVRVVTLILAAVAILYAISDHPFYGGEPGFGGTQKLILAFGVILALCVFLPSEWNAKILTLCISGLFTLAITEVAAYKLLAHKFRAPYQQSDNLIFELKPGARSEFHLLPVNGGGSVLQEINADGFRGKALTPKSDKLRIVVYGDSFIHASYSPEEETFTAQLGSVLEQKTGTAVETINAGVSSYGPDQILLKMEQELPQLKPDLVVVSIFAGNDYGDLLRNKLFKLDESGNLQPNTYKLSEKLQNGFYLAHRESVLKQAIRKLIPAENSPLADIEKNTQSLMDFSLSEAKKEYEDFVINGSNMVTNAQNDYYSADVSLEPESESARYRVRFMEAVLTRITKLAKENQVPLAFLFIPNPLNVADNYADGNIDSAKYPQYEKRNLIRPLEEAARRIDVPYLSLFDTFSQVDANELYFSGGDDHWNNKGQLLAAETMADYLLSNGLIRTKH
ncbi:MAG TPA: SGNH/GDSL hydrolase family protein [Chromatiales bacterium]|nr:SGNH/GDSL hydrolase family protein [Thiotrichales bacterium]HIP69734.1 SGNH/GDSL hydrolase family protein [Chromatiales bacterium]